MKKILLIIFGSLFMLASCKKNITSLNVDPKNPLNVPSKTLFTNAQVNMANNLATPNVNLNIFRLLAQYWTETTYTDESNYDLGTRNIPQNWWHLLYRDVLKNLDASKKLIATDVPDADIRKNQEAIIDVVTVFTYYYIVTTFGNIPYTDALDINKVQPKYDDAKTVYDNLLTKLDAAIAAMDISKESFGSADILYGGDVAAWQKFANSLKLKMGMVIADSDPGKAKTVSEQAITAGVFSSNDDNAVFRFLSAPPNTNPVWVNLVQSGRKDFVGTSVIIDKMKVMNDPRVPLYFTPDANGGYTGGKNGASNNYAAFSKPAKTVTAPNFPGVWLSYAEVEFLLAEAKERGYAGAGTAAEHYNNAVTASIEEWGGTAASATAYLAQPSVAYATAAGTYKEKIGNQKWIALYERGHDAWTEWRRLDAPKLIAPSGADSDIPLRYPYPVSEQNVNGKNYADAAAAIGGDVVDTKLWFDKY